LSGGVGRVMDVGWPKSGGRTWSWRKCYNIVTKYWWRREVNDSSSFEMTFTHAKLLG